MNIPKPENCIYCADGTMVFKNKQADGYPLLECNSCNAFAICPNDDLAPPIDMLRRRLKKKGIKMTKVGRNAP